MKLKRLFICAWYAFHGLINLVFAFFYIHLDVSPLGGHGGGISGLENSIKLFLVFLSCLSFLTTLILIFNGEFSAKHWATATSVLSIFFYEAATIFSFAGITLRRSDLYAVPFITSAAVLLLNATSLYFLHKILQNQKAGS